MVDYLTYYCYLLLAWGIFRLTVRLPIVAEELIFKPILWGLPLLSLWMAEKRKVKFFEGSFIKAILFGGGLGVAYVVVIVIVGLVQGGDIRINELSEMQLPFYDLLGVGLSTAIVEEMVFAGYIFSKVRGFLGGFWPAGGLTSIAFMAMHVPIGVFVYEYSGFGLVGFLGLVGLVSLGNYWVMEKSKNVTGPILSHWLWAVAVGLWG